MRPYCNSEFRSCLIFRDGSWFDGKISRRYRIHIKTSKGEECLETENIGSALLEALEEFRKKGTEVMDIKIDRGTLEQHFMEIAKGDSE